MHGDQDSYMSLVKATADFQSKSRCPEALGVFFGDSYITRLKPLIDKALAEGKNASAITEDINRYTGGGRFQELFDGSISDLNKAVKKLMSNSLGYINVVTGKANGGGTALNFVALGGDALAYVYHLPDGACCPVRGVQSWFAT